MSQLPPPPPFVPQPPTFTPGTLGRRTGARFLDLLLIGLIDVVLLRPAFMQGVSLSEMTIGDFEQLPSSYTLLSAVLALTYFAAFESRSGATPGKRVLRLRVYAPDGNAPSFGNALRRSLFAVAGVVAVVPVIGEGLAMRVNLFAVLSVLFTIRRSPTRQGWHDLFAKGTQVVRVP